MTVPVLQVNDLHVQFKVTRNRKWPWSPLSVVKAVNGVSFALQAGQTIGIVGESGCGKSTLIRAIAGLEKATSGQITLFGQPIDYARKADRQSLWQSVQMIFQDPVASLNPRMTIHDIVTEPLHYFRPESSRNDRRARAAAMLERVGIAKAQYNRFPHEFSGGQCQRIGIARALVTEPKILLCDEPVSALDVSIQAQVINLLRELQAEMGLSLVFVAHDLGVVRHISNDILVMYLGGVMEYAEAARLINAPVHPYTKALLSAVPVPDPRTRLQPQILEGDLPSPFDLPTGCLFNSRCPVRVARCGAERPELTAVQHGHVACLLAETQGRDVA